MIQPIKQITWCCGGQTVIGASHKRSGLVNQDSIHWAPESRVGPPLMLAISDGHGSPANFRSDVGAKCATSAAVEIMHNFQKNCQDYDLKKLTQVVHQRIPQELVRNWRRKVIAHWESNPFREEEFQRLEMRDGAEAVQYVNSQPILAYGATLLGVLITDSFILYLQLGDGDILCVMSKGNIVTPIEKDRRLIANETTSLCTEDAWEDFRVHFAPLREGVIPSLILLSTDGYSNSFKTNADFLQIGTDYLNIINEEGFEQVTERLSFILEESSREGSGDDITLGMIYQIPEYSHRSLAHLSTVQSLTASTRIETRQQEEARVSINAENKNISNHRDRQLEVRDSFWKFGIRINIGIFLISLISLVFALFLLRRSEPISNLSFPSPTNTSSPEIKISSSSKLIAAQQSNVKIIHDEAPFDQFCNGYQVDILYISIDEENKLREVCEKKATRIPISYDALVIVAREETDKQLESKDCLDISQIRDGEFHFFRFPNSQIEAYDIPKNVNVKDVDNPEDFYAKITTDSKSIGFISFADYQQNQNSQKMNKLKILKLRFKNQCTSLLDNSNEIDTTYHYLLKQEFLVGKKTLGKSNIKQFIESQLHPSNNKGQTKNFIQSINHILLEVNERNRVRLCLKAPEPSEIESCLNQKQPSSNVTTQGHSKNPGSHSPAPSLTGKREQPTGGDYLGF